MYNTITDIGNIGCIVIKIAKEFAALEKCIQVQEMLCYLGYASTTVPFDISIRTHRPNNALGGYCCPNNVFLFTNQITHHIKWQIMSFRLRMTNEDDLVSLIRSNVAGYIIHEALRYNQFHSTHNPENRHENIITTREEVEVYSAMGEISKHSRLLLDIFGIDKINGFNRIALLTNTLPKFRKISSIQYLYNFLCKIFDISDNYSNLTAYQIKKSIIYNKSLDLVIRVIGSSDIQLVDLEEYHIDTSNIYESIYNINRIIEDYREIFRVDIDINGDIVVIKIKMKVKEI